MSELTEYEDSITRSCATITAIWPLLWPHLSAGSVGRGPGGGGSIPDDDADTSADLNRVERILALRAEVTQQVHFWCRELIDARDLRTVAIEGTDVPAMLDLLDRNAAWLSGWYDAPQLVEELRDLAHRVKSTAYPSRKEWLGIGECPVTIGVDGVAMECGTPVRVYPEKPIRCTGCGTEDTLDGWILRMVKDNRPVTAEQLIVILHKRMGVAVKEATIRQWKRRGELVSIGTDDAGRDLFDRQHAFLVVSRRDVRAAG